MIYRDHYNVSLWYPSRIYQLLVAWSGAFLDRKFSVNEGHVLLALVLILGFFLCLQYMFFRIVLLG